MQITEEVLYFIWGFRQFKQQELCTVAGENITILAPGTRNYGAGPDFENSRIRIGGIEWSGNVEIHVRSTDWYSHKHGTDQLYDNIILHLVAIHDGDIYRNNGSLIPVLELGPLIDSSLIRRHRVLMDNLNWIPCEQQISFLDKIYVRSCLSRLLTEAMEHKCTRIKALLTEFKGSWEDAFYVMLARNFGFNVNALPFELLARSLPRQLLGKHVGNQLQVQSLLFGQSGLLSGKLQGDYPEQLKKEYDFLQKKYTLQPVEAFLWKFGRLRPYNFPTIRIAQFASVFCQTPNFFSRALEIKNPAAIYELFSIPAIHDYWSAHYHFRKSATKTPAGIGAGSMNNIFFNTIAPFFFLYGATFSNDEILETALRLLEMLPAEENSVINKFSEIGIECANASESQALLHLKKMYCNKKKCLNCGIGTKLLKQENDTAHANLL